MLITDMNDSIKLLDDNPATAPAIPVPKNASMIILSFFGGTYLIEICSRADIIKTERIYSQDFLTTEITL